MRTVMVASLLALFTATAGAAWALEDKLELFSDEAMTACEIMDTGAAIHTVYAFLTGPPRSTGVRFKAAKPACWVGATWVGDITPFATIGNSQTDLSVGFGGCLAVPMLVARINFFTSGTALPCCEMVASEPGPDRFGFTDCTFSQFPLTAGRRVVVNPTDDCRCQLPLAVETTTWGRVKALYQ